MARIEAAIFDVGQVLHSYDPKPIHQDIIKTLGITHEDFKKNWNDLTIQLELGVILEEEYWEKFKIQTESTAQLPNESLLLRKYHVGFKVSDEVISIVKSIKNNKIKVAILSNSIEPHYQYNKKAGLYDDFSVQVFSHMVGLRKPDPKVYELVLNRLGMNNNNNALFIDDRAENVEAAIKMGIYGHLFINATALKADLKSRFEIDI